LPASRPAARSCRGFTLKLSRQSTWWFDLFDITDPEGFKAIPPLSGPETLTPFGGRYVIRTDKITALDGTPPKRFVVIAFESVEKAQAWKASESSKKVDVIRDKTTKSSQFLVDGM